MLKKQDITQHPCFRDTNGGNGISHRSGGFGGTCERCGTEVKGPNNSPTTDVLSWVPINRPKPYQPGSLDRAIYEVTGYMGHTDQIIRLIPD